MPTFINIDWEGPHTLDNAIALNDSRDYGIYQLVGRHRIYSMLPGTLLYIGKANERTFGMRMKEHRKNFEQWAGTTAEIFVGRLAGNKHEQPTNQKWGKLIDQAESLLIYSLAPAWNSRGLNDFNAPDIHIFNWGNFGPLLPEVSSERYNLGDKLPGKYSIWTE